MPQFSHKFKEQAGYHSVQRRDKTGRLNRKWMRLIPLPFKKTPRHGIDVSKAPWPAEVFGVNRYRLRDGLAREAAQIFVREALRIGALPAETPADAIRVDDLETLADQQEEFLEAVADAQSGIAIAEKFYGDYEFMVAFGGTHWALARLGHGSAYDEFNDPDPRRALIAKAQAHRFTPPYVDEFGDVRLFFDTPPTDHADYMTVEEKASR
jgi:hypothetical protein